MDADSYLRKSGVFASHGVAVVQDSFLGSGRRPQHATGPTRWLHTRGHGPSRCSNLPRRACATARSSRARCGRAGKVLSRSAQSCPRTCACAHVLSTAASWQARDAHDAQRGGTGPDQCGCWHQASAVAGTRPVREPIRGSRLRRRRSGTPPAPSARAAQAAVISRTSRRYYVCVKRGAGRGRA